MIHILIADDEPLARENLARLLSNHPEFQIMGLAENGVQALKLIEEKHPDAVFLDMDMPGKNGLETASDLLKQKDPPLIVFVTAFHDYAIQAFEANAVDYVLKPASRERIQKTLERIQERLGDKSSEKTRMTALEDTLIQRGLLKRIAVHRRHSKDRLVLDPGEVYFFHAHLSEVMARTGSEEYLVKATLKELEDRLDPSEFVQIHKAYLVNVKHVEKVAPLFSGNFEIQLRHPEKIKLPLSRRFAAGLKSKLSAW